MSSEGAVNVDPIPISEIFEPVSLANPTPEPSKEGESLGEIPELDLGEAVAEVAFERDSPTSDEKDIEESIKAALDDFDDELGAQDEEEALSLALQEEPAPEETPVREPAPSIVAAPAVVKAKGKGKGKGKKSQTKSTTPVKSKSTTPPKKKPSTPKSKGKKTSSSGSASISKPGIPIAPEIEQKLIGNAELIHNLSKYIKGKKSIASAQDCLNEINNFRQKQIDELLGPAVQKLQRSFRSSRKTSAQPIGSLANVIDDVIGFYKKAADPSYSYEDRENWSKLGDGYLAWIAMQISLVVPVDRRPTATDLINEKLAKSLGYGEWATYNDNSDFLNINTSAIREKIIEEKSKKATKKRETLAESQKIIDRQILQAAEISAGEASVGAKPKGKKSKAKSDSSYAAESIDTGEEEDEAADMDQPETGVIRRKDLKRELQSTLFNTSQILATANEMIDKLSMHQYDEHYRELMPLIEAMETRYKDMRNQSDAFFTRYAGTEEFALPWPERPLLVLSDEKKKLIGQHQKKKSTRNAARLFLFDWLENIYRAYTAPSYAEISLTKGQMLADNVRFPEKNTAQISNSLFEATASGTKISVKLENPDTTLDGNQKAQIIFAIAYLATWLVNSSVLKIDARFLQLGKPNIPGTLIGVRDWIQSELCTHIGTNESCSLLFKTLEVVTGPKLNTVTDTIANLLQQLRVKIVVGGKDDRRLINFQELCAQCKTDAQCAEGTFAIDKINQSFPSRYADLANAQEYARAMLPNHWILKRAKSGKNGDPQYSQVDLREDAVLLIAQKTNFALEREANLRIMTGQLENVKIAPGEWNTPEELKDHLNQKLEGILRVDVKEGANDLPEFTLRSAHQGKSFSIEEEGSLELLALLGMGSAAKSQNEKSSSSAKMATSRSAGFLLAVKSKTSFPVEEGNSITGKQSLSTAQLANSIEIDANCVRAEYSPALKTLLLMWLISNRNLMEKLSSNPADSFILLDLPKLPVEHNFQSSKGGANGNTLVAVNSAADWQFWNDKWKFTTAFPKELSLKPTKMKSSKVYALNQRNAKFDKLGDKRSTLIAGSEELKKHGPTSDTAATTWMGLMLRKVPTEKEMLQLLQSNFT